jgi:hypothetical protein
MNRLLLALGALAAGALLVPGDAEAQRYGGRGFGGPGGFRGAGIGGGYRVPMFRPPVSGLRGGVAGPGRIGGFRGAAITARPGGYPVGVPGIRPAFRPGIGAYRLAAGVRPRVGYGYRPGAIYRPGFGPYRPYYRGAYAWRYPYYRRYPYYGGYYGWGYPYYDDWGWGAAGLVVGTAIGAAAASTYPVYGTPVSSAVGGYCATPVRTCALINPAPVGTGCSCRVPGRRARGTVVGAP